MQNLKDVYEAKKEFINDNAVLEVQKLKGGYAISFWHNIDKFEFVFTAKNRNYFFSLIIELFNSFDFSYFVGGDIKDLEILLGVK